MNQEAGIIVELRSRLEDPNFRFPARPVLVQDIDWFVMPHGLGIQFRGLETPVLFRGRNAALAIGYLLPRLDGTRTVDELVGERPTHLSEATLLRALVLLHEKELICRESEPDPTREEALRRQLWFWGRSISKARIVDSPEHAQKKLQDHAAGIDRNGGSGRGDLSICSRAPESDGST